jgi:hypothetical protein
MEQGAARFCFCADRLKFALTIVLSYICEQEPARMNALPELGGLTDATQSAAEWAASLKNERKQRE